MGPAKVVSRKHATIQYNGEFWELTVCGRNGVKVDKISHKEGTTRLYSGNILDIGGVQMMFVLPDIQPRIAPSFKKKLLQLAGGSFKHSIQHQPNHSISKPNNSFQKTFTSSGQETPLMLNSGSFSDEIPSQSQFQEMYPASTEPIMSTYSASQQLMVPGQIMNAQFQPAHIQQQEMSSHLMLPQSVMQSNAQSSNTYPYPNIPAGYTGRLDNITTQSGISTLDANKLTYPKGVAIVSQSQVRGFSSSNQYFDQDLSSEDSKDIKPPYSYATMISKAILSTQDHMMSLSEIYDWISSHFSFYRFSKSGWHNSIRHNLSLNKAFEKVPRKANEPGKGMKWQIVLQYKEEFQKKAAQGDHIKGKSTLAQMQRQVHMHQSISTASASSNLTSAPPQSHTSSSILASAVAVDVEAATVVANLATSPQRMDRSTKGLVSLSKPNYQDPEFSASKESAKYISKDTFSTPRKQGARGIDSGAGTGSYSDQYGLTSGYNGNSVVSDHATVGGSTSLSTPSPSHRYPTGPISQLEAYTPDRGSNNRSVPTWRGSLPQSVTKNSEMTPLNKTITAEVLAKAISNNNSNNALSNSRSGSENTIKTSNNGSEIASEGFKANNIAEHDKTTNTQSQPSSSTNTIVSSLMSVSQTPAPIQSNLQLIAPTSAQQQQLPSSFMPASSPAPFWRFMQLSSTPVRANDFSPTKFSSPPVSSLTQHPGPSSGVSSSLGSTAGAKRAEDGLGDLQNVDLTRYVN